MNQTTKLSNKITFIYDFDGTLSPGNMQEKGFIEKLTNNFGELVYDKGPSGFWGQVKEYAEKHNADEILSYMNLMIEKSNRTLTEKMLNNCGKEVRLFKGLDTWFKRINQYSKKKKLDPQHFIVSSGLKEIIDQVIVEKKFKKTCFEGIYACSFVYDEKHKDKTVKGPGLSISASQKVQYIFRISKGYHDIYLSRDKESKSFKSQDNRIAPFEQMIYFGDGPTDVPCMAVIKERNGHSICVYEEKKNDTAKELLQDKRVDIIAPADYSKNSELEKCTKIIIDKIAAKVVFKQLKLDNQNTKL